MRKKKPNPIQRARGPTEREGESERVEHINKCEDPKKKKQVLYLLECVYTFGLFSYLFFFIEENLFPRTRCFIHMKPILDITGTSFHLDGFSFSSLASVFFFSMRTSSEAQMQ